MDTDNDQPEQHYCPKCGFLSSDAMSCERCGAVLQRPSVHGGLPFEPRYHLATAPDPFDYVEPTHRKWFVISGVLLTTAVVVAGILYSEFGPPSRKSAPATSAKAGKAVNKPAAAVTTGANHSSSTQALAPAPPADSPVPAAHESTTPTAQQQKQVADALLGTIAGSLKNLAGPSETPAPKRTPAATATPEETHASTPPADPRPTIAAEGASKPSTGGAIDIGWETFGGKPATGVRPAREVAIARGPAVPAGPAPAGQASDVRPGTGKLKDLQAAPNSGQTQGGGGGVREITAASYNNEISNPGVVLVEFFSPKSEPSQKASASVDQVATEYGTRLRAVRVNTDTNPAVLRTARAQMVPTVLVFKAGKEVGRVSGGTSYAQIRGAVQGAM
jgi:thiol-disulfide isomerase/thioredoxin